MEVPDTLTFLAGTWRLDRSIEDHRTGTRGTFAGHARLELPGPGGDPRRGRYEEQGHLRFGAHTGPAGRQLDYRGRLDGVVLVHFLDGRPFVELDLRQGECRRVHRCGADRYEITTAVHGAQGLEERWRVRGPEKDYAAVTTWTRVG